MVGGETGRISTTPMIEGIGTGTNMKSRCPVNVTQVRNRSTLLNGPPSKTRLTLARSAPLANMGSETNVIGIRIMGQTFASRPSRAFLTRFAVRCRALQSSMSLSSPQQLKVPFLPFSKPQKRGTATGNDLTTTPGGKTRAAGDRIKSLCVVKVIKRDHVSIKAILATPIDLLLVLKPTQVSR
ncbi:predicted protein [Verticillium alfalfae VaMs.102]|uniref:Predicted protein n=1 Tax=Verticillium alfalfae (strain VaMs.102 / ATCC MYA-4576 / FGSC 10136) TaxID=526221 RepID=C9S7E3_VERA1|nr:predicted protein [Verticillium alfalfae VaMs.102]EEY15239.1 predicted protein [Verticillium alfalfae VaMs.102]